MLRSSPVTLFGQASPPLRIGGFPCSADSGLSFQWTADTADGSNPLAELSTQLLTVPTLVLPPRTLSAGVLSRFTLRACYTQTPADVLCGIASRSVQAVSAQPIVVLSGGNTLVGSGPVLFDASRSTDPDGADPNTLSFRWRCVPLPTPDIAESAAAAAAGCLAVDKSALTLGTGPKVSAELLGSPTESGRNYSISVTVTKPSGAATSVAVWLAVRSGVRLPVISVQGLGAAKQNPQERLSIVAEVQSADPSSLTTSWTVVAPPEQLDFLSTPGNAATPLSSPTLVVRAGALPPGETLVFGLTATDSSGTVNVNVSVPVSAVPSGLGKALGDVSVSPAAGSGMETQFSVSCAGWFDPSPPLQYAFFYFMPSVDSSSGAVVNGSASLIRDFRPQVIGPPLRHHSPLSVTTCQEVELSALQALTLSLSPKPSLRVYPAVGCAKRAQALLPVLLLPGSDSGIVYVYASVMNGAPCGRDGVRHMSRLSFCPRRRSLLGAFFPWHLSMKIRSPPTRMLLLPRCRSVRRRCHLRTCRCAGDVEPKAPHKSAGSGADRRRPEGRPFCSLSLFLSSAPLLCSRKRVSKLASPLLRAPRRRFL